MVRHCSAGMCTIYGVICGAFPPALAIIGGVEVGVNVVSSVHTLIIYLKMYSDLTLFFFEQLVQAENTGWVYFRFSVLNF